jgi:hypothetical protein
MQTIQFAEQMKAIFQKHFPNGYINISKLALGGKGVMISAGMIGDIKDVTNGIRHNDPLTLRMFIHDGFVLQEGFELGDSKLVIEIDGNSLAIKPTERHMAMGREKIPARKINNTPEKALVALDKLFAKAKEIVTTQAAANNIYGQDLIPAKYL